MRLGSGLGGLERGCKGLNCGSRSCSTKIDGFERKGLEEEGRIVQYRCFELKEAFEVSFVWHQRPFLFSHQSVDYLILLALPSHDFLLTWKQDCRYAWKVELENGGHRGRLGFAKLMLDSRQPSSLLIRVYLYFPWRTFSLHKSSLN